MASSRRTGTNENISTYGTVGRDYTVLATWEAATDNDLVTATTSEVLECYADAASYDDTVVVNGATTNSSYFRIIRAADGEGHGGDPATGVRFIRGVGATVVIEGNEANFSLQDIVCQMNIDDASSRFNIILHTASNQTCIGCIVYNSTNIGAGVCGGIRVDSPSGVTVNCLVSGNDGDGIVCTAAITTYVYNCTSVANGNREFYNSNAGGTYIAKNCLGSVAGIAVFANSGSVTGSQNNSSGDTSVFGATNVYTSQTFTFVNSAGNDYHLHRNDLGAKFRGTSLSADATFPFDDDIDGDTITYWPIGFHAEETTQSSRRTGDNENVSTFAASGADYSAIATWEAATDNDLVTGVVTEVLECDAGTYSDGLALAGATTDGRYFRIIRAATGEGHGGVVNTGVIFSGTGTNHWDVAEAFAQIQDVIVITAGNSAGIVAACRTNGGSRVTFVGVIAKATNAGAGTAVSFNAGSSSLLPNFVNCLAYESDDYGFYMDGSTVKRALNCTAINNGVAGFRRQNTTFHTINCLSDGNLTADFSGTMGANSDYNAATDATAPGANSRQSQTFTYVNDPGGNWHLSALDAGALDFGTDMSHSPEYNYTDDIDGETITTWSIGFDSIVPAPAASGGGTHLYRRRRR